MSSLIPAYTQVYKEPVAFQKALGFAFEGLVNAGVPFDALSAWKAVEERRESTWGLAFCCPIREFLGLNRP